ncbi:MAG: Lrp/AsnC family transcriptional regulator [Candidatus Omnitrophica bacterium]|nr:Lrp/AsnC family transcriptional regulator [Candidatus Omnitrophota bacterium]
MDEILEILEKDSRLAPEEISKMVGKSPGAVRAAVKKYEKNGVILKYKTIINKELVRNEKSDVRALIEVKIIPQKNVGFDHIAERIYQFPEVASCYLLSGGYDLLLVVEGRDIHTIANFVASKLAPMENVRGTVTHFLLKKYKEDGDILKGKTKDKRLAITL